MAPVDTAYYELLDVRPEATPDELSSAYRKRALKLHPDKGGSEEQFRAMKAAYDVLKDPQKRKLYDTHGPAIVRAMDGEVLEPDVMLEVALAVLKTASRMVLCMLPVFATILLLPAVVLSLKWDNRITWSWTLVFIPMWFVQIVVLSLLLKLRAVMSKSVDEVFEAGEDEESRADTEEKKQNAKRLLTRVAGFVVLLLLQEFMLAAALQGYMKTSWFLVMAPYWTFEFVFLFTKVKTILSVAGLPLKPAIELMITPLWWGSLRLLTAALLAAKADGLRKGPWMECMIPMIVGASLKLLWSCRTSSRRTVANESEEDTSSVGDGFAVACFAIAGWLTVLLLAASKLDGNNISALFVFMPFFLAVGVLLCCCACLACCGPMVVGAVIESEKDEARRNGAEAKPAEAQVLIPNTGSNTNYNSVPPNLAESP